MKIRLILLMIVFMISFTSAGTINVTINSNLQKNYGISPEILTFNASGNVTAGGTYLMNVSKYDNSSGTWGITNTTIVGGQQNDSHGVTLGSDSFENVVYQYGVNITAKYGVSLNKVVKSASSNCSNISVYYANDTLIGYNSSLVSNQATFTGINFTQGQSYYILCGHTANWYRYSGTASFPYDKTFITYVNGVSRSSGTSSNTAGQISEIVSIFTTIHSITNYTAVYNSTITSPNSFVYNFKFCDNASVCTFSPTNSTVSYKIWENSRTHNTTAYETDLQTYSINVTANTSLTAINLLFNGTNYSMANQGSGIWSYSRYLPENTVGNNSINFSFTYAGSTIYPSYLTNQEVKNVVFALCNATLTQRYLNVSFKNEADLSVLNASIPYSLFTYYLGDGSINKTYTFANTSNNYNYQFCVSPTTTTIKVIPYVQFKQGTDYPQRIWNPTVQTYTNSSTNQTLYLLGSADGIYTTFQVLDNSERQLSGVSISAVRTIDGSSVTIGTGTTDAAGSATFWVNPDFSHTFTFSKSGYGTSIFVVIPTQSSYTITLGSNVSSYISVSDFEGLKWYVFPSVGLINDSSSRTYGFNITAYNSNLIACRFDLLNNYKNVTLSTAEANATNGANCSVSLSYAGNSTYPTMKGRLLINVGSGWQILEDDAKWYVEEINSTGLTFTDWFNSLKNFDLSYFNNNENHREYTNLLIFFLLVTIICAVLNNTGWDIQTRGGMIYLMGFFVIIASIPGFLTLNGISPFDWMNQYFVAMVYIFFMIGYGVRSFT